MLYGESADACWAKLEAFKQPLLTRCENYASLTIPKILLPIGFDALSTDQTHDYQSIGAQAVNNLTNKLMLAMFAPSRPFFKMKPGPKTAKAIAEKNPGIQIDVDSALALLEKKAVSKLEELGQRPKLYTALKHLVVTGNSLLCLEKDMLRVMGIRYFCVKRTTDGRIHTLIIKERVKFDELDKDIKASVLGYTSDDSEVDHFKYIELLPSGSYRMTQWIGAQKLPMKFDGVWTAAKLPYRVLVWDLADESDYGTGLVEEYIGDLEATSILSEAIVNGGILAAEFRYLVNPTGLTTADDFNQAQNGDAIPGRKDDVTPTTGGNPDALKIVQAVLATYEQRIGRGFLVGSAVQRNAERVTAEEVRLTANELEQSFGGVYSTLAPTVQSPVAWWLLAQIDKNALGADFVISIVTGLDALSRNGDLENLKQALTTMAQLTQVPESLQERIDWDVTWKFVCNGYGVDTQIKFLLDQKTVDANNAAKAQVQANANIHEAAGTAAVTQPPPGTE